MGGIQYLQRAQIDTEKWDRCIREAPNGLIYASSPYLDNSAPGEWGALVKGDYEAVMPLPARRKIGIAYLFQPALTPVLGVFGKIVTTGLVYQFLQHIPPYFKLWDINLNHCNRIDNGYPVFQRNNYILPLCHDYEILHKGYSVNMRRNLRKAHQSTCEVRKMAGIEHIISLCKSTFPTFMKVEAGFFDRMVNIYKHFSQQAALYGVYNEKGRLLASAAFLFFGNRAYYWLVGNDEEARRWNASALLLDSFIKDHAGSNWILDFEGSDVGSIAGFYQKFGAQLEPYYTIYLNRLPPLLKWIKPVPALYRSLVLLSR